MLPRHRRRSYALGLSETQRPTLLVRLAILGLVLIVVWYVATTIISMFSGAIGRKASVTLSLRSAEGVQVSLQGEDWQAGETHLKLYAGDAVATRSNGDAIMTFFDGTRIRLDQGTDVLLKQSDNVQDDTSHIELQIRTGRIWVNSPSVTTYTGSIVRTVATTNYSADIPGSAHILSSPTLINVIRSSGIGVPVLLAFEGSDDKSVVVGEGQYLSLSEEAKRDIASGKDPYDFRDPVTEELLKDQFVVTSYAFMTALRGPTVAPLPGSTGGLPGEPAEDLVLTQPENNATITTKAVTVSGTVGPAVATVTVNGQSVPVSQNRSFSVDINLVQGDTTRISVEALDGRGLPLNSVERTVRNTYKPVVEPLRIKSPVGSGATFETSLAEIEITGEAPANTAGVMVNDYKLQLFKPGDRTWSYLASIALGNLKVGENRFTAFALDADGNRSQPRSITIVVSAAAQTSTGSTSSQPALRQNSPLTPGVLIVDKPQAGTETVSAEKEIVIEGRTSSETVSISVNGYTLSLYQAGKTTWNYVASTELGTLKRGRNVYRIVARNQGGEILDVLEYTITFKP